MTTVMMILTFKIKRRSRVTNMTTLVNTLLGLLGVKNRDSETGAPENNSLPNLLSQKSVTVFI